MEQLPTLSTKHASSSGRPRLPTQIPADTLATPRSSADARRDFEGIESAESFETVKRGAADLERATHIAHGHSEGQRITDLKRALANIDRVETLRRLALGELIAAVARAHD